MGLFKNDRRELEEALESLLVNIGANYRFYEGVAASSAVGDGVAKVKELAARMKSKGKASELEAAVGEWCEKQPPPTTFSLGENSSVVLAGRARRAMSKRVAAHPSRGPLPFVAR
jgi:hypothetical protein